MVEPSPSNYMRSKVWSYLVCLFLRKSRILRLASPRGWSFGDGRTLWLGQPQAHYEGLLIVRHFAVYQVRRRRCSASTCTPTPCRALLVIHSRLGGASPRRYAESIRLAYSQGAC